MLASVAACVLTVLWCAVCAGVTIRSLQPRQGPAQGGRLVTISGVTGSLSFGGDYTQVQFGTMPAAAIVERNDTYVVVRTPAGPVEGAVLNVSLTSQALGSGVSPFAYRSNAGTCERSRFCVLAGAASLV